MRRTAGREFVSALIAWAISLSSFALADTVGALGAARESYRDGAYRVAAGRLNELAKSESQLGAAERLMYWDLCADVALESGLLDVARKAALTHLALVRQVSDASRPQQAAPEQAALVRRARIERSYCPAETKTDLRDEAAVAHWSQARDLLAAALAIRGGLRETDPVWEAETRLQLARTLEILGRVDEARIEYSAASTSALAAVADLAAADKPLPPFLRGAAVIQNARVRGDRDGERRQAESALGEIEKRLAVPDVAIGDHFRLLVAGAGCRRQLEDAPGETRMLTDALQAAGMGDQVEPLSWAEIMVRLAELADASPDSGRPQQAIDWYHEAARLYAQILTDGRSARPGAAAKQRRLSPGQQAECLLQLQLIYTRLEEWENAIAAAEDLLQLRSQALLSAGDPNYYRAKSAVGSLYAKAARSALARSAGEVRDFSTARRAAEKAQAHLKDAAEMWRKYRPLSPQDLAATLNYYAEALRYNGEFRRAGELLEEAEPYVAAAYDADALPLGEFHSNRGAVLAAVGLFQPALVSYEAAIKVAGAPGAGDDLRARGQLLAFVYLNLAQLFKSQGQYADARQACTLAGAEAEKWLAGADRAPFLLADAALGIVEAENVYRNIEPGGRNEEARRLAAEQLQTVREAFAAAIAATQTVIDDSATDSNSLNGDSARHLQALALFRRHLLLGTPESDVAAAQRLWEQVADAPKTGGDMRGDVLRVRALNSLSAIALREAALLRAQARGEADEAAAARLMDQGNERLERAGRRSADAKQIAEKMVAYPAVRFQVLLTRAQVLNAEAQIRRASAEKLSGERETQIADESQRAAGAAVDQAIAALRAALALVELPRAMTTGAEEQRAAYFAQFSPGFDLLVDLLTERGEFRAALDVSEQRRSRTFLDQLKIAGVDLNETVPAADRHLVDEAQIVRDEYYTCLARLVGAGSKGGDTAELAAELSELQGRLVSAEERIRSSSTVYRQLLAEPLAGDARAEAALADKEWVGRQLGGDDVALVYYVGSEKSYVFECSAKHGIRGTALTVSAERAQRLGLPSAAAADGADTERPVRADDVAKLASRFALDVSQPDEAARSRGAGLRIVSSVKIRPQDLALITDILVPRAVQQRITASGCRHVLVVPDGALHQLAFESLPTDADRTTYLLDVFPPICYAPSLQIYRQLQQPADGRGGNAAMLSVANPNYRESAGTERQISPASLSSLEQEFHHYFGANVLPRLPATKVESDQVLRAFEKLRLPPGDVISLADDTATEARLKDALEQLAATNRHVGYLHVAAHGLVDQRYNNLFGALALTPPSRPSAADDGFLTLYEVMMLPLAGCDLAVLSACETNCGPENALEAGSTMARAFFCAGAQRVVCSQWKVSDEATAELVADFMDRVASDLADGKVVDYASALQQAKRRLRPREASSSPYFWAPFVLIGTPTSGVSEGRARLAGRHE